LKGYDGCCRDVAGIHGGYHVVEETLPAICLVATLAIQFGVSRCHWWLDRPVSNSGQLKTLLLETANQYQWDWVVDLDFNPDNVLSCCDQIVASSDSLVLDQCSCWFNLAGQIIAKSIPTASLVDFQA
jgi:hypothetical protein